jgi:hypothetical protein
MRTWLADALHDFLSPIEVANTLARKARNAVRRRLALLESLLMKLLLIEASRVSVPPPCRRQKPAGKTPAAREFTPEDPTNPATWRVRFTPRIPPSPQQQRQRARQYAAAAGPRIRDLGPPILVRDIWRDNARRALIARLTPKLAAASAPARALAKARKLARRFEALRRAIASPAAAIAALARKLHALGAKARAAAHAIAVAIPVRLKREPPTHARAVSHAWDTLHLWPDSS